MRVRLVRLGVKAALTTLLLAIPIGTAEGASSTRLQRSYGEDTCFGEAPTITGAPGQTVIGTSGDDVILGGGRVESGAGDDLVCDARYVLAGPGDDRIRMLDGGTARGNGGNDEFVSITISLTPVGTTLRGGSGNDVFWGGPTGELVYGGSGDDIARTGGGGDTVDLGRGDDQGYGGPGDDRFSGGEGADFVDGGQGYDMVDGGFDPDRCHAVEVRISCRLVRSP
ncbi:MAG: calcium-binding protein [Nocardioides sp.]